MKRRGTIDHTLCQMRFEQRGPHMGIWCCKHNAWIKWISKSDYAKLHTTQQFAK